MISIGELTDLGGSVSLELITSDFVSASTPTGPLEVSDLGGAVSVSLVIKSLDTEDNSIHEAEEGITSALMVGGEDNFVLRANGLLEAEEGIASTMIVRGTYEVPFYANLEEAEEGIATVLLVEDGDSGEGTLGDVPQSTSMALFLSSEYPSVFTGVEMSESADSMSFVGVVVTPIDGTMAATDSPDTAHMSDEPILDVIPIPSYYTMMTDLLLEQYKNSTNLKKLIYIDALGFDEIEALLYQVQAAHNLDTAIGVSLDHLGILHNIYREGIGYGGAADTIYRDLIQRKARQRANATPEDIIAIMKSISGAEKIRYKQTGNLQFTLYCDTPLDIPTIERISGAGVKVLTAPLD